MSSLPGIMFTNKTVVFSCESISDGVSDPETRSADQNADRIDQKVTRNMHGCQLQNNPCSDCFAVRFYVFYHLLAFLIGHNRVFHVLQVTVTIVAR